MKGIGEVLLAAFRAVALIRRNVRIGPGRLSVLSAHYHRPPRAGYDGASLRRMRAANGVGCGRLKRARRLERAA